MSDAVWKEQFGKVKQLAPLGISLVREPPDEALDPSFVYQENHILMRANLSLTHQALARLNARPVPFTDGTPIPVGDFGQPRLLKVDIPAGSTVLDVIPELNQAFGPRMFAPNHLMSICPVNLCPGDEPLPPPSVQPKPRYVAGDAGRGVSVRVIDTGLVNGYDAHPWMGPPITGDVTTVVGEIPPYRPHGTFIAGVLRCVAPATTLRVTNELSWAGAVMEDALANAVLKALNESPAPQIISLSAGSTTFDGLAPMAFEPVFEKLRQPGCTTLLVAAAGNDGLPHPFWPAAQHVHQPQAVISVGALNEDRTGHACFTNYGPWVRVFESGERLVNAFATGAYKYIEPPSAICRYYNPALYPNCTCVGGPSPGSTKDFEGLAQWSGTSFATPFIVGRIAKHMTDTANANPRAAAQSLLLGTPVGGQLPAWT